MAYPYTKVGKTDIYMGEPGDRCFFCNRSLSGKDCILESNFLICLDNCKGDFTNISQATEDLIKKSSRNPLTRNKTRKNRTKHD